jgi:hypothetical protein
MRQSAVWPVTGSIFSASFFSAVRGVSEQPVAIRRVEVSRRAQLAMKGSFFKNTPPFYQPVSGTPRGRSVAEGANSACSGDYRYILGPSTERTSRFHKSDTGGMT